MFEENILSGNPLMPDVSTYSQTQPGMPATSVAARLADPDRRAVDFLLDGDSSASQEMVASPMAQAAFMERVNVVRDLLSALDSMPVEEPGANLIEATLRRIARSEATGADEQ
jgi:hypothetical protein